MKLHGFINLLNSCEEEEIFVKVDDTLYDFELESVPECFDGFDTVYPASIALVPKNNSND